MILNKIEITPYKINLRGSFQNSNITYLSQSGYIVKLKIDNFYGYGEVSILEGFSKENMQQILWSFEELKIAIKDKSDYHKDEFFDMFKVFCQDVPSLHFALDIALLDILSKMDSVSIAKYLNPKLSLESIKISSIYDRNRKIDNDCIKIKLMCKNVNEDILQLKKIFNQDKNETNFRVDANQGYNFDDAILMCNFLENKNIEYIEEPLIDMSLENLKKLKKRTNINIAIDETVFSPDFKELIDSNLVDSVVLKPSIYGGIEKIFNLKKYLDSKNINLFFSSSLENYIGNMSVVNIIAALGLNGSHGINNQLFFDFKDLVSFNIDSKFINIQSAIGLGVTWNDS